MELLTCPACGCSVQAADVLMGRRVRCFACRHSFIAAPAPSRPPTEQRESPPPRPSARPLRHDEDAIPDESGPFCPGCGRRIDWGDLACPYCGEELEAEDGPRSGRRRFGNLVRRDVEPHRGASILILGNISAIAGGLSLCTFGLGSIVSVPLGIVVLLMATRDLRLMGAGLMDLDGKWQTRTGRSTAIAGVFLGLIFAAFFALVMVAG